MRRSQLPRSSPARSWPGCCRYPKTLTITSQIAIGATTLPAPLLLITGDRLEQNAGGEPGRAAPVAEDYTICRLLGLYDVAGTAVSPGALDDAALADLLLGERASPPPVARRVLLCGDVEHHGQGVHRGGLARRFVDRLATLGAAERRPALAPLLDRDPYLSAWTNVQVALGNAPATDRASVAKVLAELDARVEALDMPSTMREAAATRGPRTACAALADHAGKPRFHLRTFESAIPAGSLGL